MSTKAILVPSGDHAGSSWSASSRVSWTTLEPPASMVNNCSLPESIEMNTSFLPSGEGNGSKFWAWGNLHRNGNCLIGGCSGEGEGKRKKEERRNQAGRREAV